jgi:SRSO17 transposase
MGRMPGGSPEQRTRVRAYLQGLLSPIERKNGWQLAEAAGETNPYGYQELLSRARWDADAVWDDLLDLVREKLADPAAVVVIDETGFLKKGTKSVGVAPQYSGTAGKIGNCQIGVFVAYAAGSGQVLVDRELYLPREWTDDRERCEDAGVPEEVEFATKLVLARRMLERMLAHGLPFAWVTADSVYGADYALRRFLLEQQIPFVLAVAPNHQVRLGWQEGYASIRLDEWLARRGRVRWSRISAGWGSKGPRWFDWTWGKLEIEVPDGWQAWVVVRRSISDPTDSFIWSVRRLRPPCTRSCRSRANAGKSRKPSNEAKKHVGWISTRSGVGRAGIGTSPCRLWPSSAPR